MSAFALENIAEAAEKLLGGQVHLVRVRFAEPEDLSWEALRQRLWRGDGEGWEEARWDGWSRRQSSWDETPLAAPKHEERLLRGEWVKLQSAAGGGPSESVHAVHLGGDTWRVIACTEWPDGGAPADTMTVFAQTIHLEGAPRKGAKGEPEKFGPPLRYRVYFGIDWDGQPGCVRRLFARFAGFVAE